MQGKKLQFATRVTLVGGGELQHDVLLRALERAPTLIAADGAADRVRALGHMPDVVIGDMDSLADLSDWQGGAADLVHLTEQDTTDFEKCLYSVEAPGFIGVGFTGRRVDHTLAAFHAMLRHQAQNVVLLSAEDAIALVPEPGLRVKVPTGARVSFYPLVPVTGVDSVGLEWPIDGLEMMAGWQVGTSNRAAEAEVFARFNGSGALIILSAENLDGLIKALA